ncbi:MAG TPA: right-handed parallel beta-helix repeat-containing protein, partial [Cytophagaceae bacterium]
FATALYCQGSNAIIDSNQFVNNLLGVVVDASGPAVSQTISNNYFSGGHSAVLSQNGSLIIRKNTIGSKKDGSDAIIEGFGIAVENCASLQMTENIIRNINTTTNPIVPAKYNGVPLYVKNAAGVVASNTIAGQGTTAQNATLVKVGNAIVQNNKLSNAQTGFKIDSCSNIQFITNELTDVTVKGFDILSSDNILLTRNTVSGLLSGNKPIDLNLLQTSASNQSKAAPAIVTATYHDGKLHLIGTSEKNDFIELFYSDPQQSDLDTYVGSATTDTTGVWTSALNITSEEAINYFFRATAKSSSANRTSEASNAYNPALKICLVTNNADAGDGSLRDAIDRANANECNIIQFKIPQTGVVQIKPDNALPLITTPMLIIDATSQQGYAKGNPVIDLVENSTQAYAFSARGADQFFVYGLKVTGYDTALAMTGVSIVELNDNHLQSFDKAGISIKTPSFVYGNINNNNITGASGDYGIYLDGTDNILVEDNAIQEFGISGIYSNANNQKLIKNTLVAENSSTSDGIKLNNGNNGYVANNVISKAYQGIVVDNGAKHYIFSNTIGSSDPAKIAAGEVVEASAIYVTNSSNLRIYYNTVNGTQNGVYVANSYKPLVQNVIAKKVKNRVINIINCDRAEVVNNSLDSLKTGIYVSGSKHTYLNRNYIFEIAEYGILLDVGADSSLLHANVIGADYFQSPRYSEGEGIHIKSSYNIVGGTNADTATNYIFHNKKGGIVVDGGVGNTITYNQLFENDITKGRPTTRAIGLVNNGNTNKAKPQILDHKWVGDELHLMGTSSALNDSIHIYLGNGGYEEAREFMGLGATDNSGNWEVIIDTVALKKIKPQTTIYLTATATDINKNTSPLSDMYILGDCYVTSLKDTTDNEYPYPNSLRMAVNCANSQKQHVGIYFKIEEYGPKDIELQWKLQPLINPYGVTFNGKNQTTDFIPVGISGSKILPDDTVAWVISEVHGPSVFDSLNVKNFKNGIQVLADSIHIRAFHFSEIESQAIYAGTNAHGLHVENSLFNESPSAIGVVISGGLQYAHIEKSVFDEVKTSVKAENSGPIRISENTFLASKQAHLTSVWLKDGGPASIVNNSFSSTMADYKAIYWDNMKGGILDNTFRGKSKNELVAIVNSDSFTVANNNFIDSTDIYLGIQNSAGGRIIGNTFVRPNKHSIQITASTKLNIISNNVSSAPNDAFDIKSSDKIYISKNIIRNTRYDKVAQDSALCINIHKGDASSEANLGKPEPVNLRYAVKLGDDNRRGIFVQGKAEPGDSIEVFFSDSLSASMNKYLIKGVANSTGLWEVKIPRGEYHKDTVSWYHCIAVAISPDSNTSQTSSVLHIPPQFNKFYVTNEYDAGPNSLRDALLQVNVSDLYSKVIFQIADPEFQPGPYRIKLDSLIDPVYSFLGFTMDGSTQATLGLGGDQRIIVEAGSIGDNYGLHLVDSSKSSMISNLWFNNANKGVWIDSEDNTIENLNFITDATAMPKDSALIVTGNKNEIKGIYINNYRAGVIIKDAAGEITISESVIENVDTGILVADSAYDNTIEKIAIYNSFENAILVDSAAGGNVFNQIHFGDDGKAIAGNAVKINNSTSQSFINNMIAVLDPAENNDISSGFLITGNSSFNYIYNNKINIDSSGTVHGSDVRGVTIIPSADGAPSRNSIVSNYIVGTGKAAIYARSTFGDLISENHIGVTADDLVSGIDSTGIFMSQCNNSEASDNIIRGYKVYGIELKQSDNIKMNRNIINSNFTNAKGININAGSPDVSNGGLMAPVITEGILIDTQTVRLRGTSKPGSTVEIFQSVKDTVQSISYVTNVTLTADPAGKWEADVNVNFFSYSEDNCFVVQNHEGSRSSEFSNSFRLQPLLCQLAAISPSLKVIEPLYTPCPGPDFVLNPGLDSNLTFEWMSDRWTEPVQQRVLTVKDSVTNLVLRVTDKFGCELIRNTEILFKATPDYPDFIVSSNVYAGDTIVLVDISLP